MKKSQYVTQSALIAALYVVLTYVANIFGLASGAVQLRLSEALTVLPYFTPAAVPGLFVGCVLANLFTGGALFDIIFGSIATLLGAVFTRLLRKYKYLSPVPPIVFNTLIVPPILMFVYKAPGTYLYFTATIFAGEVLSCGVLGIIVLKFLEKTKRFNIG